MLFWGCAAKWRWLNSNALRRVWSHKDGIGLVVRCPVKAFGGGGGWGRENLCTSRPASRASPVVVVLNLIVAKETDLIAALARPKVLVGHVHVLHTEWATCRMDSLRPHE